jgi:hypothetical protein
VAHDAEDGRGTLPYCEEHYLSQFVPKCVACNEHVTEGGQSIRERTWHGDCFKCTTCKKPFADDVFYEYEDEPYCEEHFFQAQGMFCAKCSEPISDVAVEVLTHTYMTN